MLDEELLTLLRGVDTPTVCNAIEVAYGRRGFGGFTRATVLCSAPSAPPIVGYARTAKISGRRPSSESAEVVRARRLDYYRMMAEAPYPSVAVIEDVDHPDCIGAYWGDINATIHRGFGIAGVVTNGSMRDLGDLPEGFPIIAGSVGPSHAFVHVKEIDVSVSVFSLSVAPGDLVHADRHGAIIIPSDVIPLLPAAIRKLRDAEAMMLVAARHSGFDYAAFETAWVAFEKART